MSVKLTDQEFKEICTDLKSKGKISRINFLKVYLFITRMIDNSELSQIKDNTTRLHMIEEFAEGLNDEDSIFLSNFALKNEDIDLLMALGNNDKPFMKGLIYLAIDQGSLELVKYLLPLEDEVNDQKDTLADWACLSGHMDIIRYLDEQKINFTSMAMSNAVIAGHLEVVKFLVEEDKPWSDQAIEHAIENDHSKIVEYLQG